MAENTKEKGTKIISPVNVENRQKIDIKPGDTVRVWIKVEEKGKTRLQPFEGLVLARKHGNEAGATFTVRRISSGVGIEKIFPLYSPNIDKIEIIKRAKTRRAKLYHIRDKAARQVKRQMRRSMFVDLATESDMEAKAQKEAKASEEDARSSKEAEDPVTTNDSSDEESTSNEAGPKTEEKEPEAEPAKENENSTEGEEEQKQEEEKKEE